MSINWTVVQEEHVKEACRRYDTGEERPRQSARNTFLLFDGKRYPAKFIRGLAYGIATGYELNPNEYSGGAETVKFFKNLRFSTEYNGKIIKGVRTTTHIQQTPVDRKQDTSKKRSLDAKNQKIALKKILKQRFGHIETEAKFDWLVVPDRSSTDDVLASICEALGSFRGYKNFSTPGVKLKCDFFIPSESLIIEYDERQHFTEQRGITLNFYPESIPFPFDIECWKKECNRIKAKDPDKKTPFRDEQRAFYDSVRDILTARNGITLIRIKHGDYDWESNSGKKMIATLIGSPKPKTYTPEVDEIIEKMSSCYAKLQKKYREWAMGFESREDVISWLKRNNMKEKDIGKRKRQDSFNLLSSNWNPITIPVLREIASNDIAQMKKGFDEFSQNFTENEMAWHLLYFIHPVLHELYHFNSHYCCGYSSRLARLIRSHRQGLKAAKTYLDNKEGRTTDDSFIKSCGTTAFKHLQIHPTTSALGKPNLQNIKKTILNLEIGENCLSSDELNIAMALSTMATKSFERWIGYAPCAINEGPIFILKKGKCHSECFREIVEILQSDNPNEDIIRKKLKKYYNDE